MQTIKTWNTVAFVSWLLDEWHFWWECSFCPEIFKPRKPFQLELVCTLLQKVVWFHISTTSDKKISKNDFSEEFLPSSSQGCLEICQVGFHHIPRVCTECAPRKVSFGLWGAMHLEDLHEQESREPSFPCKVLGVLKEGCISCQHVLFPLLRMQF